ncbi:MAG: 2'-5' RNA ligase family protein [Novosphingobium sp.]
MENPYAPLIVTAQLPPPLQNWANDLRQAHFPPERNYLNAHVTLFHALPASVLDEARDLLARLAAQHAPVDARLSAVMDLGGGTAIRIESPGMIDLRDQLAEHFRGMLSRQDSHAPRLHVTIQNKVERKEAQALQREMHGAFEPRAFRFSGLALHRYLGGPWEPAGQWSFRGNARL